MRSFARALSSSRRAPPKHASNPFSAIASSSDTDWRRLREAPGPGSPQRPRSIDACTDATTRRAPSLLTTRSRKSSTSWKLWPVSTCITGERERRGRERLGDEVEHDHRVLAAREQHDRVAQLGRDLADDEDRVRLERVEVVERTLASGGRRGGLGERHRCNPHSVLDGAGPPARPRIFTFGHPLRAGPAADRRVAVEQQRVHGDVVLDDVGVDLVRRSRSRAD